MVYEPGVHSPSEWKDPVVDTLEWKLPTSGRVLLVKLDPQSCKAIPELPDQNDI
jgi:hypothetical protein